MIKSPDPSISLRLLIEHLDGDSLVYEYDPMYVNSPVTGQTELSSLCYDIMNSDEYDRPDNTVGFTLDQGELTWL
jgi:hypothetical protein